MGWRSIFSSNLRRNLVERMTERQQKVRAGVGRELVHLIYRTRMGMRVMARVRIGTMSCPWLPAKTGLLHSVQGIPIIVVVLISQLFGIFHSL
jgi:hypothetical protein